ncbi:MAG TPA: sugar kinase [Anaerolineae bacterium]|nr:sugar kinase [Anaerolineae bacterium]
MPSIWTMGEILVEIMRPRPGIPLSDTAEFLGPFPSGAPAIFIDTAARLGQAAGIIGGVGEDDFGRCVLDRLEADGVDCSRVVRVPHRSTAVAFVTYFDDGSRQFIFHIDGTPAVMAGYTPADGIEDPGFFHVMGCSLMANDAFRASILETMASFHARGAKVSFDPNIRPELLGSRDLEEVVGPVLACCSVLFPGAAELALLTGRTEEERGVRALFDAWPVEMVVVKRGKAGCTVYTPSGTIKIAAFPAVEVDPTGAGDCFDAAFLCGLLAGHSLERCGRMAAAAGALNAQAFGPMEGKISESAIEQVLCQGYAGDRVAVGHGR